MLIATLGLIALVGVAAGAGALIATGSVWLALAAYSGGGVAAGIAVLAWAALHEPKHPADAMPDEEAADAAFRATELAARDALSDRRRAG